LVCIRNNRPCGTSAQCCSSRCSRARRCRPTGSLMQAQSHAQELALAEGFSQHRHSTVCGGKNAPCQTAAQCCSSRCSRAHRCRPTR
jgi:hypothetical protein